MYGLWQWCHCGVIFCKIIYFMVCDNAITVGQYSIKLYILWVVTMLSLCGNILQIYILYGLWQWCHTGVIFFKIIYCMVCDKAITVGQYSIKLYILRVVTMLSLCGNILQSYILYWLWQCYHCGAIFYKSIYCMGCDNDVTVGQYFTKLYIVWVVTMLWQYSTKLCIVWVVTMLSLWCNILKSIYCMGCDNDVTVG